MRGIVSLVVVGLASIGARAVEPADGPPPRLAIIVNGQSNAIGLSRVMSRDADVFGLALGGQTIDCWAAGHDCWTWLAAEIDRHRTAAPRAFVWWQGESDQNIHDEPAGPKEAAGSYARALADVIARVRTKVGNPSLPVLIVELGPKQRGREVTTETLGVIERDPHARYVKTSDLPFVDGTHMDDQGYAAVSQRIQAMVMP